MQLEIDPADGPADEAPAIQVTGAPARAEVALTVAATKHAAGRPWVSRCCFLADAGGVVDLAHEAPLEGAYIGVDPAGPIWSMAYAGPHLGPGAARRFAAPDDRLTLTVTARRSDGAETTAVAIRRWRAPGVGREAVAGEGFSGRLFVPLPPGPHPAVAVVHRGRGRRGPGPPAPTAALLASRGYVALAVTVSGAAPPAPALAAGVRHLAGRAGVDPGRVAAFVALGTPVGADDLLTVLTGASQPVVRAVVATVPRSALWETVRAERITAPVLFIAGGDDRRVPATAVAELMWSRRRGSGHAQDDRYLTFAGGGQFLRPPLTPTTGAWSRAGGTPEGLARAEAAAWRAVLAFLEDYLA